MATSDYQISQNGLNFLKHYEGLGPNTRNSLHYAYNDKAGVLTIGYGHVIKKSETAFYLNGMTLAQAKKLLAQDRNGFMDKTKGLTEPECNQLLHQDMQIYVTQTKGLLPSGINLSDLSLMLW